MTVSQITTQLRPSQQPRLPAAPVEYDRVYVDALTGILRQYFNEIDNVVQVLLTNSGGRFLRFPYAAVQRTTNKTFTANTVAQITFDQNDYLNACTNDGTDGIVVTYSGIYNYQFSVQWKNTDSQAHDAWIGLRIHGTDVAGPSSQFTVPSKHGTVDGRLIAAANFYVSLTAGQYVSMYAAVNDATVSMEASAAQTSPFAMPAIPSCVATLSFVSAPLT